MIVQSTLSRLVFSAALFAATAAFCADGQTRSVVAAPCTNVWGTREDKEAIEKAMIEGSRQDVAAAINQAKQIRGAQAGCPENQVSYDKPNFNEVALKTLVEVWRKTYQPQFAVYKAGCPAAARSDGYFALGGFYARLAGQNTSENALREIARLYEATQYKATTAPTPFVRTAGLYGYLAVAPSDPCFDKTNVAGKRLGDIINNFCDSKAFACAVYDRGIFAGKKFIVADTEPANHNYDGGMAYDHAIAGVMMIEAGLQSKDKADKKLFLGSAKLAGDWAIAEPPVRNHNYTAKLVWLLAELYDLTGEARYKTALLDKLDRNLKLGVLMDADGDGNVDGMTNQKFQALTTVAAQRPGRMWDGHNARPVYHAMNAWAFVEAYVAFRDRGDKADAAAVRPYMTAMLDNVAWETNNLGVPNSGRTQIPYALLLGLWKVAAVENAPRPEWEKAARAFWNTGIFTTPDTENKAEAALNTGLYLLYKSGVKYRSLARRAS